MKQVAEIDENGFFIQDVLVYEGKAYPTHYVEEAPPTHERGFYKPRWTDEGWIEGATQEEIDEITKPQPGPPSDKERIDMLENTILFLLGGM